MCCPRWTVTNVVELREASLPFQMRREMRAAGRSKEVLKVRVVAVLLHELDEETLVVGMSDKQPFTV